jgi:glycosyltransferase involved in cell wall biosynthesis
MAIELSSRVPCTEAAPPAPAAAARSRVLHINSGNLYGGVETILATLARLRDLCPGMETQFALCHEGRLSRELEAAGAPVYQLGAVRISRPWTVWNARRALRRLLASEEFDMVICHMPWSLAVCGPAVNAARQRLGFWAHAAPAGSGWLENLARLAQPDFAIANSRFTEQGLANLFPATPHGVVYPPVELTVLPSAAQVRADLRRQLSVDDQTVAIVQVSRIEACKGHLAHLEALARLKDSAQPWVCWMVGGAQRAAEQVYLAELERSAERLGISGRVRFLGQRSDVPAVLAAADIFCQPNVTPDSFGITFVEALWAGKPVVTSALGGALEVLDESCGFLVPPGDVPALASSLRHLIERPDLRSRLGLNGPARAARLCDPAAQMEMLRGFTKRSSEGRA